MLRRRVGRTRPRELMRPWCDQESTSLCGRVRSDAGLVEQLRRELAGERLDLACELALLGGQLQHASGDRAQREQRCRAARDRVGRSGRVAARRAAAAVPVSAAAAGCGAARVS